MGLDYIETFFGTISGYIQMALIIIVVSYVVLQLVSQDTPNTELRCTVVHPENLTTFWQLSHKTRRQLSIYNSDNVILYTEANISDLLLCPNGDKSQ